MSRILVIEDNATLAQGLRNNLEYEGHAVVVAGTAAEGMAAARSGETDLVILDLMLPDGHGQRLLRELRDQGLDTPVLILTALADEADKVRGFRAGADDYVTKPFGLMELIARVEALLRRRRRSRAAGADLRPIVLGEIRIDQGTRTVTRHGALVSLRPKEYELLVALARREGQLAGRLELLREVWGYQDEVQSRTVDTHIAELRRKLESDPANPRYLLTVRKAGYRLAASTDAL
ncbi:MAG TPA: response regulator transcription factor [Gemmatimonadales bacterium]|nr:response regulator transcription factor [Gemmatimonadales bacterium]